MPGLVIGAVGLRPKLLGPVEGGGEIGEKVEGGGGERGAEMVSECNDDEFAHGK